MIIGISVGFVSGLLGVGGGSIIVPILFLLMNGDGVDSAFALKVSLGTSLAIIFPTAIFSSYNHYRNSKFDIKLGMILGCFGLIGGLFGGLTAVNTDSEILRSILGTVFIIIALNMFFKSGKTSNEKIINENLNLNLKELIYLSILGLGVGFLSGLFSLGGGIFIVPILTIIFGFSMIEAIRTSTIFISITAIGGLIPYLLSNLGMNNVPFLIGYVNILYLLIIITFSIPLTYFGAKLAYKINENLLKRILSLFLIFLALKLIGII
ncbi:MAG: sulfite exporter TauE/SafE family protein [Methanobrevibacter sp.]|nr:sulfite exporter TauE/SafE family protein [Candidatus Methanovirga australis]